MVQHHPGEGQIRCEGPTKQGARCTNNEVEGLGFCLHHVPDDLLEEAEELVGFRRCRNGWGTPDPSCQFYAVEDTDPPMCKNHGANLGSRQSQAAARQGYERKVTAATGEVIAEHMHLLLDPPPIGDPLDKLMALADEMDAFREIARKRLVYLKTSNWRYEKSRLGEQVRAEITIYERAIEREARLLVDISRLHIERARTMISAAQAQIVMRLLENGLRGSGAGLEHQAAAREIIMRELRMMEEQSASGAR